MKNGQCTEAGCSLQKQDGVCRSRMECLKVGLLCECVYPVMFKGKNSTFKDRDSVNEQKKNLNKKTEY